MRAIRTITRMDGYGFVGDYYVSNGRMVETKLWNGRIINIILDQMENIFPIPGVIIEEKLCNPKWYT